MKRSACWSLPILLLAACSPEPEPERSLYAGAGRDRLCIDGDRAGFIAYGEGDANCSVRGTLEMSGGGVTITPAGDEDCRITATAAEGSLRLDARSGACGFYCGPGADFSGRLFRKVEGAPSGARDFAGDPLC